MIDQHYKEILKQQDIIIKQSVQRLNQLFDLYGREHSNTYVYGTTIIKLRYVGTEKFDYICKTYRGNKKASVYTLTGVELPHLVAILMTDIGYGDLSKLMAEAQFFRDDVLFSHIMGELNILVQSRIEAIKRVNQYM